MNNARDSVAIPWPDDLRRPDIKPMDPLADMPLLGPTIIYIFQSRQSLSLVRSTSTPKHWVRFCNYTTLAYLKAVLLGQDFPLLTCTAPPQSFAISQTAVVVECDTRTGPARIVTRKGLYSYFGRLL